MPPTPPFQVWDSQPTHADCHSGMGDQDELPRFMREQGPNGDIGAFLSGVQALDAMDAVLTSVKSQVIHKVNEEMNRLIAETLTSEQFIQGFLQRLPEHIKRDPAIVHAIRSFCCSVLEEVMPRRSKELIPSQTPSQILEGIERDVCVSGGRFVRVQVTYDGKKSGLSYESCSQGVRVYRVVRHSRVTISAMVMDGVTTTIVPIYVSDDGEDRKDPKELPGLPCTCTALCASILSANETEDRWRLDLDHGRSLATVSLCAA